MNVPRVALAFLIGLVGCDVSPVAAPPAGAPPTRGVIVVAYSEGYSSTNVAYLGWDGALFPSLLASSARPAGLSQALSGNVVVPPDAPAFSGEIVILDRGQSVVTWLDPDGARVKAQLPIADGFAAFPSDYFEVSATKAYVPRWYNAGSGQGDDLVVVDLALRKVSQTIPLHGLAPGALSAAPERIIPAARPNEAWVVLPRPRDGAFCDTLDGALARLDTLNDRVIGSETIAGLKNCGGAARLDEHRIVIACAGLVAQQGGCKQLGGGGIVVLRDDGESLVEESRFTAETMGLAGVPLTTAQGVLIEVAGADLVVFGALGDGVLGRLDQWFSLDLTTGASSVVEIGHGEAIKLGDVRCDRARAACLGADAGKKTLRRYSVRGRTIVEDPPTGYADAYGLLPFGLGRFQ